MTHGDIATSLSTWDIDGGLAADFDGSLSGLGTELGSSTYNMSEALLALPVFKQENIENGFQYVLGAATSPAVKLYEESVTYLNQEKCAEKTFTSDGRYHGPIRGQSYEIKVKAVGDLSEYRGKLLKSVIKIQFHDRRLQYMEKEHLERWRQNRPGERILDIDIPLSYGIVNVTFDPVKHNCATFVWDPTVESGIYVRVHCISTEFTAKKHGGEKGVPFRLEIMTYANDSTNQLLNGAYSQIKVFKPKGADRKHKTDREKMEKRPESEKDKFQPSYECTVFNEIPLDAALNPGLHSTSTPSRPPYTPISKDFTFNSPSKSSGSFSNLTLSNSSVGSDHGGSPTAVSPSTSYSRPTYTPETVEVAPKPPPTHAPLQATSTAQEVTDWLNRYRFGNFVRIFQNFSGADLLRLSRDDLIQICGLADGIRLCNAMQAKAVRPVLTLYLCQENDQVYHALYMTRASLDELTSRLALLFSIQEQQILDIYIQGPSAIHVLVTDQVICNLNDQSMFIVEGLKDPHEDISVYQVRDQDAEPRRVLRVSNTSTIHSRKSASVARSGER